MRSWRFATRRDEPAANLEVRLSEAFRELPSRAQPYGLEPTCCFAPVAQAVFRLARNPLRILPGILVIAIPRMFTGMKSGRPA